MIIINAFIINAFMINKILLIVSRICESSQRHTTSREERNTIAIFGDHALGANFYKYNPGCMIFIFKKELSI